MRLRSGSRLGRWIGAAAGLCLVGAVAGVALAGKPGNLPVGGIEIRVGAHPIPRFGLVPGVARTGRLDFVGGLELWSEAGNFGGFSGIALSPDGRRVVMISDAGAWLTARLEATGDRPDGLADVRIAPMLGPKGRTLRQDRRGDAEGLALTDDGRAYVGLERVNQLAAFRFGAEGVMARAEVMRLPPEAARVPFNRGFEAVAVPPEGSPLAGSVVIISERSGEPGPATVGFVVGGPSPGRFLVKQDSGYDVTDAAFAPDGDLILLERRYALPWGLGMRIRRMAGAAIRPGASLDGETLIEAGSTANIDNMEGLAVSRGQDGRTLLTLVSDDNFSPIQRTILLRFAIADEE